MSSRYLTENQTAELTGLSARSLQRDRIEGKLSLPWVRVGARRIMYSENAVREWLASRTFTSFAAEIAGRVAA